MTSITVPITVVSFATAALLAPAAAAAQPLPANDPFYAYAGPRPLAEVAPGTVLKTRERPYAVGGLRTPIRAVQLQYRSTDMLGRPVVNVTSVLLPPSPPKTPRLVAYQSFYDSLSPADQPSYAIAGGTTLGSNVMTAEALAIAPLLARGYTVTVPDTEGQQADFAAGPEYGRLTLDAIRATYRAPEPRLPASTPVGLIGYSGGAIATEWAAELAATYAPDIAPRIVGSAFGGVLVHPAHNLHYVDGSSIWSGVMPMAIVGVSRSFDIDLTPYLSASGLKLYRKIRNLSIANVLGGYPGLGWKTLAKPEYQRPEDIAIYVKVVNQLIMGTGGTPTAPLYIGQGAAGEKEGTRGDKPGIGRGDGVMIAGDVRTLARTYCDRGVPVQYRQFDHDSHIATLLVWMPSAINWLARRFAGAPPVNSCAAIAPGNDLSPLPEPEPAANQARLD